MITEQVKQGIIEDYEENLGDIDKNLVFHNEEIENYISGIWWDLLDSMDYIREDFNINPDMDTTQAAHIAEKIIRRTLEDYYFNLNK